MYALDDDELEVITLALSVASAEVSVACAEVCNGVPGRRPCLVLNGLNGSTVMHYIRTGVYAYRVK